VEESVAVSLNRARALHSSQPSIVSHHDELRRLPIRLQTEEQAAELSRLLVAGDDKFVWVQCATERVTDEEVELIPNAPVLFRFLRCLQDTVCPVTEISFSGVGIVGEAFKALLSVLRSNTPPIKMLLLDEVGMTTGTCTELALAACESTHLRYLSVARNQLEPACGAPLAQCTFLLVSWVS
jgi:hypothetical protein